MENTSKTQSSIIAIIVMMFLFAMISFVTNLAAPFGLIWGNQYSWAGMMGNMMNFLAYLFMGIPAGIMLTKIGYKKTAILAMAVGIAGFIVLINLLSFRGIDDQIDRRLDILEECKGTLNPIPPSILDDEHYFEVSVETRYFTVVLDGDEVVDFKVLRISDITRSEALDLVSKAKKLSVFSIKITVKPLFI